MRLIRDGEEGGKGVYWRWGKREIIYLSLHCHHLNDFCIKMGSDESHCMFHNCEGQSHKTVSTDHNLRREKRAEADSNRGPSAYQPNALPLGQTGSQYYCDSAGILTVPLQKTTNVWNYIATVLRFVSVVII